jgi:hypothetical protein
MGMRGGKFRISRADSGHVFKMKDVNRAADMSVSGEMDWNQLTDIVLANVTFSTARHSGSLAISWDDRANDAQAEIHGHIDGLAVAASRIAP